MIRKIQVALLALCSLAFGTVPAPAASSGGIPQIKGEWHPTVGAGAVYQLEQKGQPAMTWEIAVVGQEANAYWIENRTSVPGEAISKMLMAPGQVKRLIVKAEGQPAMEFPAQAAGAPQTDLKQTAKLVGHEQITTPAGTFGCDHYQILERGGPTDVWVTPSVSPYGLVKMTSSGITLTLAKVVKGAKSRITETPQKIEMPNLSM